METKMAQYLSEELTFTLEDNIGTILNVREQLLKSTGVDLLSNDTLSNIMIQEIVRKYDQHFEVNMARNGEDARTQSIIDIELKTATLQKHKRGNSYPVATFQFHAMGDLAHDSFLFAVRDKTTLKIVTIYDVRLPKNVGAIENRLQELSDNWYEKAQITKTKYDVISVNETFLQQNIQLYMEEIDGVKVYRDY